MDQSIPATNTKVLVFDSGLGGLTVLREIARARTDVELCLVADDAAFPYGRLDDRALTDRVVVVLEQYIKALEPGLVVVACNTASTLALPVLRARFSLPFVGTVPAVKPACAQSKSKRISVLATSATVRRDYTRELIHEFASECSVTLVGSDNLAAYAEAALRGEQLSDDLIRSEIGKCFMDDGGRTDTVVLACTHYPLILDRLERVAPWAVGWLDPAPAIARRASQLLGTQRPARTGPGRAYFTSGKRVSPALERALSTFGILSVEDEPIRVPV
jgi:glutamate racemase